MSTGAVIGSSSFVTGLVTGARMFVTGSSGCVTGSSAFVAGSSAGGGGAGGGGDGAGSGLTGGAVGATRATSTGREGCPVAELGVGLVGAAGFTPAVAGGAEASAPELDPVCAGSVAAGVGALGERLERREATADVRSTATGAAAGARV